MRIVLYTGKGGVGKTTTAAATACRAAECGHRVLVVSADAAHSLGDVFGQRLGAEATLLAPRLSALEIDTRSEMRTHWGQIHEYLVAIFRYQGIEAVVAEELALLPGAEELMALLALEEHATSGAYDVIVVDCAPTDTTLRLATLPEASHSAIRIALRVQRAVATLVTPLAAGIIAAPLPNGGVFKDAERLLYRTLRRLRKRITDRQTSVRLVVTPERMVIDEARRAFTELALFDLGCDLVVMNRFLPSVAQDEEFFRAWGRLQRDRLSEVTEQFAPTRVLVAPLQPDEVIGLQRLNEHGAELFAEHDPAALLSDSSRVRFLRRKSGYGVVVPLPFATLAELDVTLVEDELMVRAGTRRRALKLPRRIASCDLAGAQLRDGELVVSFERPSELDAVGR